MGLKDNSSTANCEIMLSNLVKIYGLYNKAKSISIYNFRRNIKNGLLNPGIGSVSLGNGSFIEKKVIYEK